MEKNPRSTNRDIRSVALVQKESDLSVFQELDAASKMATIHYLRKTDSVYGPAQDPAVSISQHSHSLNCENDL